MWSISSQLLCTSASALPMSAQREASGILVDCQEQSRNGLNVFNTKLYLNNKVT